MVADGTSTFLVGESLVTFEIIGLENPANAFEAVRTLRLLRSNAITDNRLHGEFRSKYFDYLVALDGRLAGRSYRDIAEALYGPDRIGPYWTEDSRGYKSKVIRAAKCGLALMNGGYRDLL